MKLISALVCALTFLIVGTNALPGVSDFFANFESAVRRSMTIPPSQVKFKRGPGLLPFASDEVGVLRRQDACSSSCTSSSDTNVLQNSLANATCALDTGCVCNAIFQLSSGCQSCLLAEEGYSTSSFHSACSAATSVIAVGTAVASAEEALASGTGSCVSQCGNQTELAGLDAIVGCGNNALCICAATNVTSDSALSEGCLTCLLQQAGTTESGLQSMCNAALATGSAYAPSAASTGTASTTATGSASATSPSSSSTTKSSAIKVERMYAVEAICFAGLASTFFFLA